jgi:2-polyprenyl-3-methyl-5-hydroxy-6-metoxy-1,4-benzoquinol methylase
MNPYRIFYRKQSEWHNIDSLEDLEAQHKKRIKYYEWYTKNWLPKNKEISILDVGCGAGQFIYFLNKQGYTSVVGIDIDKKQIELANALGLKAQFGSACEYLESQKSSLGLISILDVAEHFTSQKLFPLMESVYEALVPGGHVIVSVPNAISPIGLSTRFSDITHETCFSPATLAQMFFCHNMAIKAFRDPWPAPVSKIHKAWRMMALVNRKLEKIRLKSLGLSAPDYWSPVIWAIAEKQPAYK